MGPKFSRLKEEEFKENSIEIVKAAQNDGITLRILGAMAIYIHVSHDPQIFQRYLSLDRLGKGNPMFTDLDLAGYSRQWKEITRWFEKKLGFLPNFYVNSLFGDRRNIFQHPEGLFDVDIFYDKLSFSHDVKFIEGLGRGRLVLDLPTITLTDLALEKLQIHRINRKDLVDLFALFASHEVLDKPGQEAIDGGYVANVLSSDWGFEYDAMSNIQKLKSFTEGMASTGEVSQNEMEKAISRITNLSSIINRTPKSRQWEKRAKKGTARPWYNDVDEVER